MQLVAKGVLPKEEPVPEGMDVSALSLADVSLESGLEHMDRLAEQVSTWSRAITWASVMTYVETTLHRLALCTAGQA